MSQSKIKLTRSQLLKVLRENSFDKTRTAEVLGVGETSVHRACRRLKIDCIFERKSFLTPLLEIPKDDPIIYSTQKGGLRKAAQQGKFVIVPDLHAHSVIWPILLAVCEFIKDFSPSHLIQLGDLMDYECLLGIGKKKYPSFDGHDLATLDREFQATAKIVSMLNQVAPKGCKKIFLEGNHEYRVTELLRKAPEFEKIFKLEKRIDMAGWELHPYLEKVKLGKLNVIHGEFFGDNPVKKHLRIYQKNVVFGHTHMIEQSTLPSPMREIPIWGATIGCLCTLNAEYMRNRSSQAEHGFGYGWFDEASGDFDCKVVRIIHNKFWAEGKRYGSDKVGV